MTLLSPAQYQPWGRGVYDVAPGLKPFGTDFGNGRLDQALFQMDSEFPRFRASKLACMEERASKYRVESQLDPVVASAAAESIARSLCADWPELFTREGDLLNCAATGENVAVTLDDLLLQVSEDVAIVQVEDGVDWISYLNLCSPSHWAAESKIGSSFFKTHLPIPGFERVNAAAGAMVDSMVRRGPYVRFVWGVESDDRPNHHPVPPPGQDPAEWHGRQFEKGWTVRFERQVVWGLPEVNAALFVIRVGLVPPVNVMAAQGSFEALCSAVRSMSPASLEYKGLQGFLASVLP